MPSEELRIKNLYCKLMNEERATFPAVGESLDAPDRHGVYVIFSPRDVVVHVGRTVRGKNGLRQRLNNHLHGASSFVKHFLHGKGARLRDKYKFSYLEVSNARTRALLESLAVGSLCPKHLGDGQNVGVSENG
jgi:hypothetical protein